MSVTRGADGGSGMCELPATESDDIHCEALVHPTKCELANDDDHFVVAEW